MSTNQCHLIRKQLPLNASTVVSVPTAAASSTLALKHANDKSPVQRDWDVLKISVKAQWKCRN